MKKTNKTINYILKVNSASFSNYVIIVLTIIIINRFTNNSLTVLGIGLDALFGFLLISTLLNLYHLDYLKKIYLNPSKTVAIGIIALAAWFFIEQNSVKSILNIINQVGTTYLSVKLSNFFSYGLLLFLYLFIIRFIFKEDD